MLVKKYHSSLIDSASTVNFNLKKKGLEDKISLAIVILRCIEMFTNYLLTFL